MIQNKRLSRDTPEELQKIQELEEQVETLKMETRNRLCQNIDKKYEELTKIRSLHEKEIETMTRQIDSLQEQLEEAMKSRLSMITRQVRIGKLEICLKKFIGQTTQFSKYTMSQAYKYFPSMVQKL